jgi:hypothetical protein
MQYLRWMWAKMLRRPEPDTLVVPSADGRHSILTD